MQRAAWLSCFFSIALVGLAGQAESKTINLICKVDQFSTKITANEKDKYVVLQVFTYIKEKGKEFRQTYAYKDGDFSVILKHESVISKDGRQQEGKASQLPLHQRVFIDDNKIQFGTDRWLNTIDMGAGGIYYSHKGPKGSCAYAN